MKSTFETKLSLFPWTEIHGFSPTYLAGLEIFMISVQQSKFRFAGLNFWIEIFMISVQQYTFLICWTEISKNLVQQSRS